MDSLRPLYLLLAFSVFANVGFGQTGPLTCAITATPLIIRSEGLSEQVGDIVAVCGGGQPNQQLSVNLVIQLTAPVTNKLDQNNTANVFVTADNGTGPVPVGMPPMLAATNSVAINAIAFQLSPAGTVRLRISNLRVSVNQQSTAGVFPSIQAFLSFNSGSPVALAIDQSRVTVAAPQTGLLSSFIPTIIQCQNGLALPENTNSFSVFYTSGARFFTSRVTEGFADAFAARRPPADTGTWIIVRYNGLIPGSRVFVPDLIAGTDARQPTSAGDFGTQPSGGQYQPSTGGSLLLARVLNPDPNGAGGALVSTPGPVGSAAVQLDTVSEVPLTNGAGFAVFEVVDSDPFRQESAQVPSFVGVPRTGVSQLISVSSPVTLGPISNVASAAAGLPTPRYAALQPPTDCNAFNDCGASYRPQLGINYAPFDFTVPQGAQPFSRFIGVSNTGAGALSFAVTVTYQTQSLPFLRLVTSDSDLAPSSIRLDVIPTGIAPGTYRATITVNAGDAGTRTVPVTLTVVAPPAVIPPAVTPAVAAVRNAASGMVSTLAPGALASIYGSQFGGSNLGVTFDGQAATVLYASDSQINLLVPAGLAGKTSAQLVVTVNGVASPAQNVLLAPIAPAIFGAFNQDNSLNTAANGARSGSVIQIFATGLLPPSGGTITAQIEGRTFTAEQLAVSPFYAGPAPGATGLQQVNLLMPEDLASGTAQVRLCGTTSGQSAPVCSQALPVTVIK